VTLSSSRAPLPGRIRRTRPVTNNGKAFPQYCSAFVHSFFTSSQVCLLISGSQSRPCSDAYHQQFKRVQHPTLSLQPRPVPVGWQHTTARLFEFPMSLYFSPPNMPHKWRPVWTTTFLRTSDWERFLGGQWIRNERGLTVGWVVWGQSYLNRNASVAFSGLGPSESVEAQGGERSGSQSLTTRNGMERAIETCNPWWEGRKFLSIVQVRLFVYCYLPPFLPTSIILVQFLPLNICFPHTFSASSSYISSFSFFTAQRFNSSNPLPPPSLCGYHRRTEVHATTPCACFVGPNCDLFGRCVGSALNNVSTLPHLLDANSKSRCTIRIR